MKFHDYIKPFYDPGDYDDELSQCVFCAGEMRTTPRPDESWLYCSNPKCRVTDHARDCKPSRNGGICLCGFDALHERIDRAGELAYIEGDAAQLNARRGA